MTTARPPAVAGTFYPADAPVLRKMVDAFLCGSPSQDRVPRGVVAPHAGFRFSGAVAGHAFSQLRGANIPAAIIIGPSHYVAFDGIAVSGAASFATPLGEVAIDATLQAVALKCEDVHEFDAAHAREHSVETHLPFLQVLNPQIRVLPVVTGRVKLDSVAELLSRLWSSQVLLCVSTDLSHFEDDESARRHDADTADRVMRLDATLSTADACGATALSAALMIARRRAMQCELITLRNSADAGGPRDRVVGYGAFGLYS